MGNTGQPDPLHPNQNSDHNSEQSQLWNDDSLVGIEDGEIYAKAWLQLRERECRSLKDQHILKWHVWRIALREEGQDGQPQFDDPTMPFKQCTRVYIHTLELGWVFFQTMLDYDGEDWGIYAERIVSIPEDYSEGIYRADDLADFSTGRIDAIRIDRSDYENIEMITISVEGKQIWFVAAEAYEQFDGSLKLTRCDERIFLFTDEESLASISWEPLYRQPIAQQAPDEHLGENTIGARLRLTWAQFANTIFRRLFGRS